MKHFLPLFILVSLLSIAAIAQPPPPPGLASTFIINEVDYDQQSSDTAEFIEIYNFGTTAQNINTSILVLVNGATSMSYDTIFFPSAMVAAGDYYVVCGAGGNVPNCDFMLPDTSDIVQNGSPDAILLFDVVESVPLDGLSYEGDVPFITEGTGVPTNMSDNNDDFMVSLSRLPNGVDTDDNSVDFSLVSSTPGEPNAITVSIEENKKAGFVLYPNPVSNELNVLIPGIEKGSQITISNMLGKELSTMISEADKVKMNTTFLPDGVYFVSVENQTGKITKRFIKR
ncbi:MAG: hypothetical protein ACI85F_001248 [Bacteroidia bacterium]|jgi:hypothetical protein